MLFSSEMAEDISFKLCFKTKTNFTTLKRMQEAICSPPKVPYAKCPPREEGSGCF
jgi:hypothetical protein